MSHESILRSTTKDELIHPMGRHRLDGVGVNPAIGGLRWIGLNALTSRAILDSDNDPIVSIELTKEAAPASVEEIETQPHLNFLSESVRKTLKPYIPQLLTRFDCT